MLSALRLPGNIEGRLADLQAGLFRERGLLSARALPPLVPLLWSQTPPELDTVDPAPLPPLTVTGPAAGKAGIVLGLSPLGPLEELARCLGEEAPEGGRGAPFALGAPAILLAPAPAPHPDRDPVADLAPDVAPDLAPDLAPDVAATGVAAISGTVIRSFTLVVIEIRVWEGEGPDHVVWEEVARRRLRKQRG